MAGVMGLLTELETPFDGPRVNRWWITAEGFSDALDKGEEVVGIIRDVFGTGNTFTNVHVWVPGATPNDFRNRPISVAGVFSADNPTSAVPCLKFEMSADSASYVNAKYFRIGVNASSQSGRIWNSGVMSAATTVLAGLGALGYLTDKNGNPIVNWAPIPQVEYRQLSKTWYNRGS